MTHPHPAQGSLATVLALVTAFLAADTEGAAEEARALLDEAVADAGGTMPILLGLATALLQETAHTECLPPQLAWQQRALHLTAYYSERESR